jgi:hypothetical protein
MSDKKKQTFISQLVDTILVVAGNEMTTENDPDRDYQAIFYANAVEYVKANRFNVDFGSEIEKRRHLLQPMMTLEPIDDTVKVEIMKTLTSTDTAGTSKLIKTLFARFQGIKSDSRNIFGPPYTQAKKLHKSGKSSL